MFIQCLYCPNNAQYYVQGVNAIDDICFLTLRLLHINMKWLFYIQRYNCFKVVRGFKRGQMLLYWEDIDTSIYIYGYGFTLSGSRWLLLFL